MTTTAVLLALLGHPDYRWREYATQELLARWPDAGVAVIDRCRTTADPEARRRCEWVIATASRRCGYWDTFHRSSWVCVGRTPHTQDDFYRWCFVRVPAPFAELMRTRPLPPWLTTLWWRWQLWRDARG